jgi:Spy/CpxP family protein refolding chaperone
VHEAGQAFAGVLADGVAAGAIDRTKADAAIEKIVEAAHAMHEESLDALNQLHAALNKEQREKLLTLMHGRFEHWKASHGRDEHPDHAEHPGPLAAMQKDLGLSQDQVEKIRASFKTEMTQHPQDHEHKEAQDHMKAFAEAWKSDSFDAKSLGTGKDAAEKMARFAATRMARVLEAAAPVLTPDQRAKLSAQIRERSTHKPA